MYTFKVCFEGDVRRFSHQSPPTFTELTMKLTELFHLMEPYIITYLDEVGDNITISQNDELEEAYLYLKESNSQILRLSIIRKSNFNLNSQFQSQQHNNSSINNVNVNNNNNNNGSLDSLFVSLLSNQFVQQMIPQVINNLASNPALMTSIIQTTSNTLRNQPVSNVPNPMNNNFHTSIDSIILNGGSNSNIPTTLVSTSSSTGSNIKYQSNTTPTTTSTTTSIKAKETPITSPVGSTYSSLDSKSFEEISGSPQKDSPISQAVANDIKRSPSPSGDNNKQQANIFSQVPKIFNHIPFPFSALKSDSPNSTLKKDSNPMVASPTENINSPTSTALPPSVSSISNSMANNNSGPSVYQIHPNIYQPSTPLPSTQLPTPPTHSTEPIQSTGNQLYPVNPFTLTQQQLSGIKFHPLPTNNSSQLLQHHQKNSIVEHPHISSGTPQYSQPLPPLPPPSVSSVQQPTAPPAQPVQQTHPVYPVPVVVPQQPSQPSNIIFLQEAFMCSEQRAKEILDKYNGNVEDAIIMESQNSE